MSLLSTRPVYRGRIISLDLDTVRFPDGSTGELEMVRHPGAAAVLPFLDDPRAADPRVVLIRQYRWAAGGELWEVPAGRLDPGEAPEACAARELEEETGWRAARVVPLLPLWTTPGFTDERIHLFAAAELTPGEHRREADEFLEVHELRWSRVMAMVVEGAIRDAKTLATLFLAERLMRAPEQS
ncbi:MAG TPA: NUDIX hydrolase [Gemmatimonadales bacterium]|nr:NUDIX hydrolase [Gemmatimonadales bacterium]